MKMKKFVLLCLILLLVFPLPVFAQVNPDEENTALFYHEISPGYYDPQPSFNGQSYSKTPTSVCLYYHYSSLSLQSTKMYYYGSSSYSGLPDDFIAWKHGIINYLTSSPIRIGDLVRSSTCYTYQAYKLLTSSKEECSLVDANNFGVSKSAVDALISFLPEVPEQFRLATLFSKFNGDGSLVGIAFREVISATWQFLLIIAIIKVYQLIPFKFS